MERQQYQPAANAQVAAHPYATGAAGQPGAVSGTPPAHAPEHLGLGAVFAQFRQRFISLGSMSRPQRVLTIFVIGAVAVTGLLILFGASSPDVTFNGSSTIPVAVLFGALISLVVAWSLLLTGAIHSAWFVRWPGLVAFTLLAVAEVFDVNGTGTFGFAELFPLALLWVWAIIVSVRLRRAARAARLDPASVRPHAHAWIPTLLLVIAALVIHEVQVLIPHDDTDALSFIASQLDLHLTILFFLLIPLLLIAGTQFAEWGEAAGTFLAAALTRRGSNHRHTGLFVLTALVALAISLRLIVDLSATSSAGEAALVVGALGLGMALVWRLVLAFVRWLGHIERWPHLGVPKTGMVVALLAAVGVSIPAVVVSVILLGSTGQDQGTALALVGLILLLVLLLPITGLILLIRGRRRPNKVAVTGLFLLITSLAAPFLIFHMTGQVPGFELFVAPATLVILLALAVLRRLNEERVELVRQLLILNVGLEVIDLLRNGFPSIGIHNGGLSFAQGGGQVTASSGFLYILAFLWSLLLSGGQGINVDGVRLTRSVRLLLFQGYNLLLATLVLFLSSAFPASGASTDSSSFDAVNRAFASWGLQLLGVPLLLTLFVLGVARWQGVRRLALPGSAAKE